MPLCGQVEINTLLVINTAAFTYYDDSNVDFAPGGRVVAARQQPVGRFILGPAATVSGAAHHHLVDGYVRKLGSNALVFPIGWDTLYAPVRIAPQSAFAVDAAYWRASTPHSASRAQDIVALAAQEYWHITASGQATVSLTWRPGSALLASLTQLDQLTIAAYNTGTNRWEAIPSSVDALAVTGGMSNLQQGSISMSAPQNLGAYRYWTLARRDACAGVVTASISGNTGYCQGTTATLTASGGTSYSWSTGATTAALSITTGGTYTVTVTDGAGCTGTANITITFSDCSIPDVISIGQLGCSGAAFGSVVLGNLPAGFWTIEQSGTATKTYTGTGTTYTITGLEPGVYRFRVKNEAGAVSGYTPPFAVIIARC
jgi:hypothetical protein